MNFYASGGFTSLKLGDVVRDFFTVYPELKGKPSGVSDLNYKIIVTSQYHVVLSPTCSIREHLILLSPLIRITDQFVSNPYLVDDFTRINRRVPADKSLPPKKWAGLKPEERAAREAQGDIYIFYDYFIFEGHDLFDEYSISRGGTTVTTRFHMVDFRKACAVCCRTITAPERSPVDAKLLELSEEAGDELRAKLAFYFGESSG